MKLESQVLLMNLSCDARSQRSHCISALCAVFACCDLHVCVLRVAAAQVRWRVNGQLVRTDAGGGAYRASATGEELYVTPLRAEHNASRVQCVASNSFGEVVSAAATLTVLCTPYTCTAHAHAHTVLSPPVGPCNCPAYVHN